LIIDDTTITVCHNYRNWLCKGSRNRAEEDSISEGDYDDEEDNSLHDHVHLPPLRDDITQDYDSLVDDAGFLLHPQNRTNDQLLYQRMDDEPFRCYSDTSDCASSHSSFFSNFPPSTNVAHVTNLPYKTIQPVSQPPQQQQTFQDHENKYQHNQDYSHNALKMHVPDLNNAKSPEIAYDQEYRSNGSRAEFRYGVKPQFESGTFELGEVASGISNGYSYYIG
jgi:hypothetical protein